MTGSLLAHVSERDDSAPLPEPRPPAVPRWLINMVFPVAFVLTGNLMEGYNEKRVGAEVGRVKKVELEGRGHKVRDGLIRGAVAKANNLYAGMVAEAQNQARRELETGRYEREIRINQGHDKGVIPEALANGFVLALMGDTPELVRLVHERAELEMGAVYGRYLKVDRKTGNFEVREIAASDASRAEMQERLSRLRDLAWQKLDALTQKGISNGARELASFAGAPYCRPN